MQTLLQIFPNCNTIHPISSRSFKSSPRSTPFSANPFSKTANPTASKPQSNNSLNSRFLLTAREKELLTTVHVRSLMDDAIPVFEELSDVVAELVIATQEMEMF